MSSSLVSELNKECKRIVNDFAFFARDKIDMQVIQRIQELYLLMRGDSFRGHNYYKEMYPYARAEWKEYYKKRAEEEDRKIELQKEKAQYRDLIIFCFLYEELPPIIEICKNDNLSPAQRKTLNAFVNKVYMYDRMVSRPSSGDIERAKESLSRIVSAKNASIEAKETAKDKDDHKGKVKGSAENRSPSRDNKPAETMDLSPKDFVVIASILKCTHAGHSVSDIIAKIKVRKRSGTIEEIEVPASYCKDCGCCYILSTEYDRIVAIGTPICTIINETTLTKIKHGEYKGKTESLLYALGYNVSAKEDLVDEQRQLILVSAIENGLITQGEIMSHLSFLITFGQNNKNKEKALPKWENDLAFISEYKSDKETTRVKSITKRDYITETSPSET